MRLDKKIIRLLAILLRYIAWYEMENRGEMRNERETRFVINTVARVEQLLIDNSYDSRYNSHNRPDIVELCEIITEALDRKENGAKERRGGRRPYGTGDQDDQGQDDHRLIDVWRV